MEDVTCFADDKFPLVWDKNKKVVTTLSLSQGITIKLKHGSSDGRAGEN